MHRSVGIACLLAIIAALSCQTQARLIGFPLLGVRTNVVEYDLATSTSKTLMENLNYATSADVWYSTSDPESNTAYFHGFELPVAGSLSLVKVDLQTKTAQSLRLVDAHNASMSLPFYHTPSKTVYVLLVTRNVPGRTSFVSLVQVDFNTNKTTPIRKYGEFDGVGHAVLVPQGAGSIIATVSLKDAPSETISIDLATGDYKTLANFQYDPILYNLQWIAFGLNTDGTSISILAIDNSLMIDGQRNMTVIHWNLADGAIVRAGEPFLFPPATGIFSGTPSLVSSTFEFKTGRFFASFSDHSSASGIVAVDAATGKQAQFSTFSKWNDPRELTTL